jgi:hypothetical protein
MNSKTYSANGLIGKLTLGVLAAVLLGSLNSGRAMAQTINTNTVSLPVAKVVPNPCTGGFVLITGNESVQITTTQDSTGFDVKLSFTSSGKGEDALADGTLLTDGTQKPKYNYSGVLNAEVAFASVPSSLTLTVPIGDYLQRELVTNPKADDFMLKTVLDLSFNNGVPGVPTLRGLNVKCE